MHTGCALLVRQLGRLIFPGANRIGFFAALIFLFLPGHIFGVLMISALTGLLCTLFYLGAVVAHLHGRNWSIAARILGPCCFILALLTKELALSLPLLIAIWEAIALHSEKTFTVKRWFQACLPYGLVTAGYLLFRLTLFGEMPSSPLHANIAPLRLFLNGATYTAKCVVPWGLEGLKPFLRTHPLLFILGATIGAALVAGTLIHWRQRIRPNHLFGMVWFAITVLPVLSLYSPWNTYLPSVGSALIIAALCSKIKTDSLKQARQLTLASFLTLSIIYSLDHQNHWHQARSLSHHLTSAIINLERDGPIYLANLPAEWNDAPLFISEWALQDALRLQGHGRTVFTLANVIKQQREDSIAPTIVDPKSFTLQLTRATEFFRLDAMEILSGQRQPEPGFSYRKGDIVITIASTNEQGQANTLHISMGSEAELSRVYIWNGDRLFPLAGS